MELNALDLAINEKKSVCIRIGPRSSAECANISMCSGRDLLWVNSFRYLGIVVVSGREFNCSFKHAKAKFYRAFNAIFSKIGRIASENIIIELLTKKCLPVLLYGVEACPVSKANISNLQFALTNVVMKIFDTRSKDVASTCCEHFGVRDISTAVKMRTDNFLRSLSSVSGLMQVV